MPDILIKRLAIVAFFLYPQFLFAQTLEQAWEEAIASNYSIRSSQQKIQAARHEVDAAESANMPVVSVSAGYTVMNEPSTSKLMGTPMQVAEKNFLSYDAKVMVPIYTGGKISSVKAMSKTNLSVAQQDRIIEISKLKIDIADVYISLLRLERLKLVAESHVKSLEAHFEDIQALVANQMAAKTDRLAVQVSLADARQKLLQVDSQLTLAKSRYNQLMGRQLDKPVETESITLERDRRSLKELLEQAIDNRIELKQLENVKKLYLDQAEDVKSDLMPQVALQGGYSYTENRYQQYQGLWAVTLGFEWTLYDGGINKGRRSAMAARANGAADQKAYVSNAIQLEVRSAWVDREQSRQRIIVTEQAIMQAEENLKSVKARYRVDMASNSEVLDAETQREQAYTNFHNATYDEMLASLKLRYAIGEI